MATINRYTTTRAIATSENGVVADIPHQMHTYESRVSDPVSGGWIIFPDGSRFRKPTVYGHREAGVSAISNYVQRGDAGPPNFSRRDIDFIGGFMAGDYILSSLCPPFPGNAVTQLDASHPVTIPNDMRNESVTKALNKLGDQKADIGEDLATFRQTLGLLFNPCMSLKDSLKSAWENKNLRKYLNRSPRDIYESFRKLGRPLDPYASAYLVYVYGWKPLVQDIYGVAEFAKESGQKPLLLSGKGTSKRTLSGGSASYHDFSNANNVQWTSTEENSKVTTKLWAQMDPNGRGLRSLNQLGLLNPLSLNWDLVSWSFVVDWFVPIGPVFDALSAPAGLKFVAGTTSIKSSIRNSFEEWRDPWGVNILSETRAAGTAFGNIYSRGVWSDWPVPGFWFSDNPFAGDRPFKALALAIMNLRPLRLANR